MCSPCTSAHIITSLFLCSLNYYCCIMTCSISNGFVTYHGSQEQEINHNYKFYKHKMPLSSQTFHLVIWQTDGLSTVPTFQYLNRQHHFSPLPSLSLSLHHLPISTTVKNTHANDKSDTCQKINTSSKYSTVWLSYISLFYFSIFDLSFNI